MCVNKTLLESEGIAVPSGDWTWENFYNICAKVTRDTDGDGETDQFGCYGYTWQDALPRTVHRCSPRTAAAA